MVWSLLYMGWFIGIFFMSKRFVLMNQSGQNNSVNHLLGKNGNLEGLCLGFS